MVIVPRGESKHWAGWRGMRLVLAAFSGAALLGVACSDEDEDEPTPAECIAGSGVVAGAENTHCVAEDGSPIVQVIGACETGTEPEEEEEGEEHDEEEEHAVNFGSAADDDDCKYRVSFTNTCVALDEPVTFTLSLTRKSDNQPGTGTNPAFPEVFLADDLTHISPSNNITAEEGPDGTYEIGPVVFDRSGRWVIRFHYFENCSDLPPDSPHGHAAFYIDVP